MIPDKHNNAGIDLALVFRDISRKPYNASQDAIRKLNHKFDAKEGLAVRLPIRRLIATQASVRADFLEAKNRYNSDRATDLPVVVRYQGSYYVSDGHHRIVAQHWLGQSVVEVFLIDLDDSAEPQDAPLFEQIP